jgi:hypothetical protein
VRKPARDNNRRANEGTNVDTGANANADVDALLLTVYFGAPSMFITLWFGFDYGTNPPLGTLII